MIRSIPYFVIFAVELIINFGRGKCFDHQTLKRMKIVVKTLFIALLAVAISAGTTGQAFITSGMWTAAIEL